MRLHLLFPVILCHRLCLKLGKSELWLAQLVSKVTLELRISPEMSYLHKIQVNKSGSSVQTERVKLRQKKRSRRPQKDFCLLIRL